MLRVSARAAVAILIAVLLSSLGVVAGPAMADTTDVTPPGQVTNLQITTGYRSVVVHLTEPTDVDYGYYVYVIAPGGDVPPRPSFPWSSGPAFIASGLSMGTDYTLAVWTVDRSGNASAPVVNHFTTLLDTQPPHPVTGLTLTGSAYTFTASWTPPTDSDLQELDVTETDNTTGTVRSFLMGKTATGYTRREPGGHTFTIAVTAMDTNGLVSDVSTATTHTDPDDGAPPPVAPSSVTFSPTSGDLWISFPRPALPDLAALAYAVVPLGQDPLSVPTFDPVDITSANIGFGIYAPPTFTVQGGQLVLRTTDLNGNTTVSAVPGLRAAAHYALAPSAPTAVTVSSPGDDVLDVGWTAPASSTATSWTITAVSGPYSRILTVPGQDRQARLTGLAGQRNWTVDVSGRNDNGYGGGRTADPVAVTGAEPPPPVVNATAIPDFDAEVLTWRNPASSTFDHVEITQLDDQTQTRVVYRGRGPFAHVSGLLAGHGYTFEIRSFDRLDRAASLPVTLRTTQAVPSLTTGFTGAIPAGSAVTAYGQLDPPGGYYHLGGQPIILESRPAGSSSWRRAGVAGTTMLTFGAFQPVVHPLVTTQYRLAFKGNRYYGGGYSPVVTVVVESPSQAAALAFLRSLRGTARIW